MFKNKCVCIKIGALFIKSGVLFITNTKINNKKADRAPARARPVRRPSRACTGWRAVGFFVVYFCVFNEKHTDFNKKYTELKENTLVKKSVVKISVLL